jgi:hypothetical protein
MPQEHEEQPGASPVEERCVLCTHPFSAHGTMPDGTRPCRSVGHPDGLNCEECKRLTSPEYVQQIMAMREEHSPAFAAAWAAYSTTLDHVRHEIGAGWQAFFTDVHQAALASGLIEYTAPRRPPVVVICGSTRFMAEMAEANLRLTAGAGGRQPAIVLAPACNMKQPHELWADPADAERLKAVLDEIHRAKIRMADWVLVVNPGGYIGDSTGGEIEYARELGKPVRFTDPPARPEHAATVQDGVQL